MAQIGRVKVELREGKNDSPEKKERAWKTMKAIFKRRCDDAGIANEWKRRQYYESKSEKKRRKRKEATIARLKEHFINERPNERPSGRNND